MRTSARNKRLLRQVLLGVAQHGRQERERRDSLLLPPPSWRPGISNGWQQHSNTSRPAGVQERSEVFVSECAITGTASMNTLEEFAPLAPHCTGGDPAPAQAGPMLPPREHVPPTPPIGGFSDAGKWTPGPAYTLNLVPLMISTLSFPLGETLTRGVCTISVQTCRESTESTRYNGRWPDGNFNASPRQVVHE